ncbi:4-hydroxythreonine-4-phosphate dehydrogenase PdxA [Kiloniella sp. EL199]|uniref:4-hydroxythreonine-4-phosphate dehydrogenase PdxA n=1 Tax=Kiloniella sp. EL199 TaxID=2107581 RepID=UPI000EA1C4DF|nr:4-hydroxythreonine-4-phosphate dehydrogenase PdxA [Kiloniella sp. EL199]
MNQEVPLPIAITMGDPAGIGGELTLKAWERLKNKATPFFVIDCPDRLTKLASDLSIAVPVKEISSPDHALDCFSQALPVISEELQKPVVSGIGDPDNGSAIISSIKRSVNFVQNKEASAVVTNPINKAVLYQAGFKHPGHTEYLADLANSKTPSIMMLASRQLRVIPVTIHLSLKEAINKLDNNIIAHTIRTANTALKQDFGIPAPRFAVSGLNPHAGENGSMGTEEIDLIIPTLELLQSEGIDIRGPLPADTMFHAKAREEYDVAVCMYHDQALIPIKTLDFDSGVNITLGLPFIRTSPDHGTAYNIAGQGIANPNSFIAAIEMATTMAKEKTDIR